MRQPTKANASTFQQLSATNATLTTQIAALQQQLHQQQMAFMRQIVSVKLANTIHASVKQQPMQDPTQPNYAVT
jgi:hypothetical protein